MFSVQLGNHLFIGKLTQTRNPHIDIYLIDGQQNAQRVIGKDFTLKEWTDFYTFIQELNTTVPVAEGPAVSTRHNIEEPQHEHLRDNGYIEKD